METTIDSAGRIVVPKKLRDALGLSRGTILDVSSYGLGLTLIPRGRTAHLVDDGGRLVAHSERTISDADVFALIDAGRR
ncbi:MAG: AbrB/MazE/SpoVT family DNA-binding domain-containing protein [Acidimicrobiales bacterium]